MKISIGILAYNEEDTIVSTIKQILQQDVFLNLNYSIQLVIITNGCTDNTEGIAKKELETNAKLENFFYEIISLKQAGKSNAWNEYVHTYAWDDANYYVLLDADIEFGSSHVIRRLVEGLESKPTAEVAVDRIKKDIEKQLNKGLLSKLSLKISEGKKNDEQPAIAGSLYCIRGETIRSIYMPVGLPVEDGFLRAMVVTSNFTFDDDYSKITLVDDVCHYFKAVLSPLDLYKHEKRLIIGSTINSMLFNYLWKNVDERDKNAGKIIRELNEKNNNWLANLINEYKSRRGFWFVPRSFTFKYLEHIVDSNATMLRKIVKFPIALMATLILIVITIDVNFFFRRNNGIGHW